jgi:hypothetical protein
LFWAKYARRIFAIVSTTSIPNLAPASPTEATVNPPSRGSRLDADHPENGVLIPCRFTARAKAEGKYKGRKPTARARAAEIAMLKADGLRPTDIARQLGIGRASVYRVLAA